MRLGRALAAVALGAASTLVSACIIDADLSDKTCPCIDGYVCDDFTNKCVDKTCDPELEITALTPVWATPHSILWSWTVQGSEALFLTYEMVLAENEEDLRSRKGTAKVFDVTSNPELAHYHVPYEAPQVLETVTRGLDPEKTYFARLYVVDAHQCAFPSTIVARKTPAEARSFITLFGEGPHPEGSNPRPPIGSTFVSGPSGEILRWDGASDPECDTPEFDDKPTCGQPVGVQNFSNDLSRAGASATVPALEAGSFDDAYLEVEVELVDSPEPVYFAWLRLLTDCIDQGLGSYVSLGMVIPHQAGITRMQVPLRELANYRFEDTNMNGEQDETEPTIVTPFEFSMVDVEGGGRPVCEVSVGGKKFIVSDLIMHRARVAF